MNHSLYQDGILKALPFKRLPWARRTQAAWNDDYMLSLLVG